MDIFQSIVLALIQGITEFLPISSSAHLILPQEILGWDDQGLAFDVAVHVGSLIAVIIYFRQDVSNIALAGMNSLLGKPSNRDTKLALFLVLATIPAGLCGLFFEGFIETNLRGSQVIACTTLVGAVLLIFADRFGSKTKEIIHLNWKLALFIGVAQVLALIPGTSRSGITITAALIAGLTPTDSARFSFLLSIPIIALGGLWQALQLIGTANTPWTLILLATSLSGISAYLCIHYFLKLIQSIGLMPFVIYRFALGLALLLFL